MDLVCLKYPWEVVIDSLHQTFANNDIDSEKDVDMRLSSLIASLSVPIYLVVTREFNDIFFFIIMFV